MKLHRILAAAAVIGTGLVAVPQAVQAGGYQLSDDDSYIEDIGTRGREDCEGIRVEVGLDEDSEDRDAPYYVTVWLFNGAWSPSQTVSGITTVSETWYNLDIPDGYDVEEVLIFAALYNDSDEVVDTDRETEDLDGCPTKVIGGGGDAPPPAWTPPPAITAAPTTVAPTTEAPATTVAPATETPTTVAPASGAAAPTTAAPALPATGNGDSSTMVMLAALMLGLGVTALAATRRRQLS